ncbi:MAG: hypothetical protein ABI837_06640 [Acidobacteriota bacterium]
MRIRNHIIAVALAGVAIPLLAGPPVVTLLAPQNGERLDGGSEVALAWSAANLPSRAEEWEAFLSVDDGAHYPIRVTPHLDTRIAGFRWRVPNVAASRARLLLRFGDESDEQSVVLPQTFTIVAHYTPFDFASLRAAPTEAKGEAALDDREPSTEWVSGDRDGEHLVTHRHRGPAASSLPLVCVDHSCETVALCDGPVALRGERRPSDIDQSSNRRSLPRVDDPPLAWPLLLLSTRLNV